MDHILKLLQTKDRAAVVLLVGKDESEAPYTWVAERRSPGQLCGRFNAPGGTQEPNETSWEAALREVQEEAGIELPREALVYCGYIVIHHGDGKGQIVTLYFAELPVGVRPHDMEPQKLGPWKRFSLEDAKTLDLTPGTAALLYLVASFLERGT